MNSPQITNTVKAVKTDKKQYKKKQDKKQQDKKQQDKKHEKSNISNPKNTNYNYKYHDTFTFKWSNGEGDNKVSMIGYGKCFKSLSVTINGIKCAIDAPIKYVLRVVNGMYKVAYIEPFIDNTPLEGADSGNIKVGIRYDQNEKLIEDSVDKHPDMVCCSGIMSVTHISTNGKVGNNNIFVSNAYVWVSCCTNASEFVQEAATVG